MTDKQSSPPTLLECLSFDGFVSNGIKKEKAERPALILNFQEIRQNSKNRKNARDRLFSKSLAHSKKGKKRFVQEIKTNKMEGIVSTCGLCSESLHGLKKGPNRTNFVKKEIRFFKCCRCKILLIFTILKSPIVLCGATTL